MRKVLHYTIGMHWPSQGGVETAIYDAAKATKESMVHYVMAKGGKVRPDCGYMHFLPGVERHAEYAVPEDCRSLSSAIPARSCEFNASTIERISKLSPDTAVLYADDCYAMYVPFIKMSFDRKVVRVQSYRSEEQISLIDMTHADALVVFSDDHAVPFRHRNDLRVPIFVLPKLYDEEVYFDDGKERPPHSYIYAGRFASIKRLDELLAAFEAMFSSAPDAVLTLVGGGGDPHSRRIASMATDAKRRGRKVELKDWMPPERLAEEYRRHRFVVIPSREETFCATALEAMACGCTLVRSNTSMQWAGRLGSINGGSVLESMMSTLNPPKLFNVSKSVVELYSYRANRAKYLEVFGGQP